MPNLFKFRFNFLYKRECKCSLSGMYEGLPIFNLLIIVKRFSIDNKFDFDSIDAKVLDGLLTLTLPYTADVKPRKIKVS